MVLHRIEAGWKPGERIPYRDAAGRLDVVRFAGVSVGGAVSVWTNDGRVRAVPVEFVAVDWTPDAAEILEERLAIMGGRRTCPAGASLKCGGSNGAT